MSRRGAATFTRYEDTATPRPAVAARPDRPHGVGRAAPAYFRAVLIGCESGDRHPMSMITFPDEATARAWCEQTNRGNHFGLTRWEWEPLPAE